MLHTRIWISLVSMSLLACASLPVPAGGIFRESVEFGAEVSLTGEKIESPDAQPRYPLPLSVTLDSQGSPRSQESEFLFYRQGNPRYRLPDGKVLRDERSVGPLYPNAFDVVNPQESAVVHQPECDLSGMYLETIYPRFGVDARLYIQALGTRADQCGDLPKEEQAELCRAYHSEPACASVKPLVLTIFPDLDPEATPASEADCDSVRGKLLSYTRVPKQSEQWEKIERDLRKAKREQYAKQLRQEVPIQTIEANLPSDATVREREFAIRDWVYERSQALQVELDPEIVREKAKLRYSPSAAVSKVLEFDCKEPLKRYRSFVFSEAANIPAHEIVRFGDLVREDAKCICPTYERAKAQADGE